MKFADHFSRQASSYSKFRPRYPQEMFAYLATLVPARRLAWDCGTGNGQAAVDLAAHFEQVVGSDPSVRQVEHATAHPRVDYVVARAEACPLEHATVDLVSVAQALHWFDRPRFYAEVRRVARSGAVLAVWAYGLATLNPAVDRVVAELYGPILGRYWPPERRWVEEGYRTIDFPFDSVPAPEFSMTSEWTLDDLAGYLRTWSSVQKYIEKEGADPLQQVAEPLAAAWGPPAQYRAVRWPLVLRLGRV